MLTDTHCHLASHRFNREEIPGILERAGEARVTRIVTLATCLEDIAGNLAIAANPGVHCTIGIHPCDVHNAPDDAIGQLSKFLPDPRIRAIGETGLDYYHPAPDRWNESNFRQRQQDFLHQHFQLAAESDLNIVIHTRDLTGHSSFEDALAIYKDHHQKVRAVFHCFIGPMENAIRVLELGGLVSFGGVATFKSARALRETILACPAGTFMLETDSPYLAPEPHRGKRNEPAFVFHVARRIAELRGETLEQLAAHTNRAAETFFKL